MVIAHRGRSSPLCLAPAPARPGASSEKSEQCERLTLSAKARGRMDASCHSRGCVGSEIWWLLCPVTFLSHNFKEESKNEHNHSISPGSSRDTVGEFFFLQSQQMFFLNHMGYIPPSDVAAGWSCAQAEPYRKTLFGGLDIVFWCAPSGWCCYFDLQLYIFTPPFCVDEFTTSSKGSWCTILHSFNTLLINFAVSRVYFMSERASVGTTFLLMENGDGMIFSQRFHGMSAALEAAKIDSS